MPVAWRIVKQKHAVTAFSGKGAADSGGRWNTRGVPVVYASSTQSLAALETLVHLNPLVLFEYVVFRIQFDDALLEKYPLNRLPVAWQVEPPSPSTQMIGNAWVREARSAVLALPSGIVSGEPNYLLNPAHPGFKKISIRKPEPFAFDPRLLT